MNAKCQVAGGKTYLIHKSGQDKPRSLEGFSNFHTRIKNLTEFFFGAEYKEKNRVGAAPKRQAKVQEQYFLAVLMRK